MVAQKGSLFLLKVGDGGGPEVFTTVGGLRTTSFNINNGTVDVTNKDSSGMRELLAGGGIQTMSLSGEQLAQAIAEIHRIMHDADLTVTGHELVNLRFELTQTFLDADGITHHGVTRFRAVTHQA